MNTAIGILSIVVAFALLIVLSYKGMSVMYVAPLCALFVALVNGIPLLFVELKKNTVDVQNAYTDNYTDYLDTIPHLFYYNAFLILSNGLEAKVGTLGSKYEFFHEWKRLKESDAGSVELETMLRGI